MINHKTRRFLTLGARRSSPWIQVALVLVLSIFNCHGLNAQIGCPYPGTCNDPVPVIDITTSGPNYWTDTYGLTWNPLTSTGNSVSGSVVVPGSEYGPSCPSVKFDVKGSIQPSIQIDTVEGYSLYSWTGSNPKPSAECNNNTPVEFTYSGTIQNKGNDYALNSEWSNVTGEKGTSNVTKEHDVPVSETTNAVGFGSASPNLTVAQFRQILNASSGLTDIFAGRQVFEATGFGSPHYDNCWQTWSIYPKWNAVDGSLWNVGYYPIDPPFITSKNEWGDDYIGYGDPIVKYYRTHYFSNGVLCGARIPQVMSIEYDGSGPNNSVAYANGTVGEDIYTASVTAYRAGVSQSTNH